MDELIDLEHAGWAALCNGTASDFYGATMTEDGVMVLANGSVMDREAVVASLRQAPPWASYEMADVKVVPIAPETAALVYTGTGHRDGAPAFVGVMTSVYVRRGSEWRLALYQQTPKT